MFVIVVYCIQLALDGLTLATSRRDGVFFNTFILPAVACVALSTSRPFLSALRSPKPEFPPYVLHSDFCYLQYSRI